MIIGTIKTKTGELPVFEDTSTGSAWWCTSGGTYSWPYAGAERRELAAGEAPTQAERDAALAAIGSQVAEDEAGA